MLKIIKDSEVILITAGAGIGVDSGLPDFRGKDGFWKEYPLLKDKNLDFASIANPKNFNLNPELAWAFYGHRYDLYKQTIPHEGFQLLLDLVKTKEDYFVITSNVDGQFQKAKFDIDKIYEIHGRIDTFQCSKCGNLWKPQEDYKFGIDKTTLKVVKPLPYCECGYIARPNIMMFNDFEYNDSLSNIQEEMFDKFLNKNKNKKILVIEIGAGTAIPTIRSIGEFIFKNMKNSSLIRINPRESFGPEGIISMGKGGLEGIKDILT